MTLTITQSGIIAGNAFHNDLIINSSLLINAPFPTLANGIVHAMSLPAWEVLELTAADVGSIDRPIWTPEAHAINSKYVSRRNMPWSIAFATRRSRTETSRLDPEYKSSFGVGPDNQSEGPIRRTTGLSFPEKLMWFAYGQAMRLRISMAALALIRQGTRRMTHIFGWIIASTRIRSKGRWIHISYGAMQLPFTNPKRWGAINVLLEHGTVRWSYGNPTGDARERLAYREMCRDADHVWVTNLDQRTLELIDELAPNSWSAIPHPYRLDPSAPYAEVEGERAWLRSKLNAEFVIFSGSSLSLGGDQNKGTHFLLEALRDLVNEGGESLGLVVTHWGNDIESVKSLIADYGIGKRVLIVPTMSRTRLQKMMAACDLVSDQFHFDAFGSLTIKALEQGMPVLTRGLGDHARELIGELPPFIEAHNTNTIRAQIVTQMRLCEGMGHDKYMRTHRQTSRGWLLRRHHHDFTLKLQEDRYAQLVMRHPIPALPNAWAMLPDRDPSK
jgi:hypothetical protein